MHKTTSTVGINVENERLSISLVRNFCGNDGLYCISGLSSHAIFISGSLHLRIQLHSEVVAMKLRWMAEKQNNKADAAPKGVVIWLIKTGVMENILSGIRLYGFNPMPDHKADEKLKNWKLSPHCKQLSKIMNDIL